MIIITSAEESGLVPLTVLRSTTRAGRDGLTSSSITFYQVEDFSFH